VRRVLFAGLLGATVYLLLPRLGGLNRDAAALRHARIGFMLLGILVEALSILAYVVLYRTVLAAGGIRVPLLPVGEVTMAAFLVSHLVPGGSAAGTIVNVWTMEDEGVPTPSSALAVTLTVLLSDLALLVLFFAGLVYSLAKKSLPIGYLATAAVAIPIVGALLGTAMVAAFRPAFAEKAGSVLGRLLMRIRKRTDPDRIAARGRELSIQARSVLSGRSCVVGIALAMANWLLDVGVLYLFFLAVRHHQHFGALLVAYSVANMLSAIPITPGGLGVIEATLIAISVGFGAPHQVAVIAVLGYRLVNYWLPLPVGAAAYVHLRAKERDRARRQEATGRRAA
jgi:uncharacterized protein (TIRG00374 family)